MHGHSTRIHRSCLPTLYSTTHSRYLNSSRNLTTWLNQPSFNNHQYPQQVMKTINSNSCTLPRNEPPYLKMTTDSAENHRHDPFQGRQNEAQPDDRENEEEHIMADLTFKEPDPTNETMPSENPAAMSSNANDALSQPEDTELDHLVYREDVLRRDSSSSDSSCNSFLELVYHPSHPLPQLQTQAQTTPPTPTTPELAHAESRFSTQLESFINDSLSSTSFTLGRFFNDIKFWTELPEIWRRQQATIPGRATPVGDIHPMETQLREMTREAVQERCEEFCKSMVAYISRGEERENTETRDRGETPRDLGERNRPLMSGREGLVDEKGNKENNEDSKQKNELEDGRESYSGAFSIAQRAPTSSGIGEAMSSKDTLGAISSAISTAAEQEFGTEVPTTDPEDKIPHEQSQMLEEPSDSDKLDMTKEADPPKRYHNMRWTPLQTLRLPVPT
ncbi:hypothetical protein BJ875DRAFT_525359 [Amylocarpus encephaloides]|uniref:Uncharacterized protein n=1 Tax=Amylocarpus encephaloides TaxID=45428 RepID=A0A9P8C8W7_9HELO|nr:hypothetical protein BJ875DRAFT_525359 [Amylocarpus encephaloides]